MMMSIGQLSKATNCKVATIRYYEDIGLMPTAYRSSGNQRQYQAQDLVRLRFIRHGRDLGFDLAAIRALLTLGNDKQPAGHKADDIARRQLEVTRSKIARLQSLEKELESMLSACEHQDEYQDKHQCRVMEVLADHALCQHDH